ncbi:DUF4065 domain-containing protein [Flavihumibacter sp. RY-1]|uniref:DUF4065 domain-containing protein n=1 Tax=Flavihumibacter fluminis TaxID=2909236 RepID=A0ABS9BI71_9BACT|nr:type II toxin-antitoxin system antitoxin SocA domain-containing protein [Flavihumibacter fluminis]MCF1715408.1 DUF4065 domain-containing protein [Flavihumibacter fluminis]
MRSPITGKEMKLVKEVTTLPFRKEEFEVVYHYYLCEDSKEQFTDDELDAINITQVHNQYREKYGIPFPEEIKSIREKYNVSASKIAEILGFGTNNYRLYETGEMPSVSNGRLILSINQPEEFIRQVEASSHILSPKEVSIFIETAKQLEAKEKSGDYWEKLFEKQIFQFDKPNEYSGYKKPDFQKISQVIAYFNGNIEMFKTKLNKLLFYADFTMYQRTGHSITGIRYRAIPFGPVPADYEKLYLKLQDDQKINIVEIGFDNGNYGELIESNQKLEQETFSEKEKTVLDDIINKFKGLTTKQVVDISHKELAWTANIDERKIISYQKYAFALQGIN